MLAILTEFVPAAMYYLEILGLCQRLISKHLLCQIHYAAPQIWTEDEGSMLY